MRTFTLVFLMGLTAAACSSTASSPVAPSVVAGTTQLSMAGSWAGASADSAGGEQLGLNLTQNGTTVNGTLSFGDPARSMMGNGTMQGTLNGRRLTFHMTVPNGGFAASMSPCSMSMDGYADMSEDGMTLVGTYQGQMSGMMSQMQNCGGALNNGQFTLRRQ